MMTKTIKVVLKKVYPMDKDRIKDNNKDEYILDMNKAKEEIKRSMFKSCQACNKASDMYKEYYFNIRHQAELEWDNLPQEEKDSLIKKIKSKYNQEKYAKSNFVKNAERRIEKEYKEINKNAIETEVYMFMKNIMNEYNTGNVQNLNRGLVVVNWKRDKEGVLNYTTRPPQYKENTPYSFTNSNYTLTNEGKDFYVELSFFSTSGYETRNLKQKSSYLKFKLDKIDNSKKQILLRMINKEYKQGSASISISKKGKIEFSMSFSFEEDKNKHTLDPNRILGIDLGIVNTATMSIYDSTLEQYDWFSYKRNIIDGGELLSFRQKYYNIRQNLGRSTKYIGDGSIGHGYKTRCKKTLEIQDKVARFSDTYNHKISRYIVDFAIKNNCGTIQMEDLTNATQEVQERMLKEWAYYDLQEKVKYKCQEVGIEVIFINPKYTSKRCNKCGRIHIKNRDCKKNQEKFICQVCGHKDNADINASKNIAMPNIDDIIKNTEVLGE